MSQELIVIREDECLETMYVPGDDHHVKICRRPAKFNLTLKEGYRSLCGIHARMKKYSSGKLTKR